METRNNFRKSAFRRTIAALILAAAFVVSGSQSMFAQASGEALFKQNCSSCHFATSKRSTGPGLEGVTARRSAEWLMKWILNPAELVASGDSQAVAILKEYNNFPMPAPNLKEEEIKSILTYIEQTEIATKEKAKADSLAKATAAAAAAAAPSKAKPQFMSTGLKWALAVIGLVCVLFFFFMVHVNNVMVESVGHGLPYFDHSEGGRMEAWVQNNKAFVWFFAIFLVLVCLRFIWAFLNHL